MKKRWWMTVLCIALALVVAAGCQNTSSTSLADNASASAEDGSTYYGQVTAVDGSSITLALGTISQGNGDVPEMPSGDAGTQPSGEVPEMPSGNPGTGNAPDMPSGDTEAQPSGGQGGQPGGNGESMPGGSIELTGEELTITVTDSMVITVKGAEESAEGSVSDIAVGSVLSVTMSGDTVTAITIMQSDGGMGDMSGAGGTGSTAGVSGSAETGTGGQTN